MSVDWGGEREPLHLSHTCEEFSLYNMDVEEMRDTAGPSLLERVCILD